MSTPIRVLGLLVAVTLSAASSGWAQKGAVELGVDMEISYKLTDNINGFATDNVFQIGLPLGNGSSFQSVTGAFRAGFFVSDAVSIEPAVGFSLINVDETFWSLVSSALILYHFNSDPTQNRFFVAVGPNFTVFGGDETATQFGVLGEGGVKLPVADKFALRLAAGLGRFFENDDFIGRWDIFGTFGFSVFLGS